MPRLTTSEFSTLCFNVKSRFGDIAIDELVPTDRTIGEKVPKIAKRLIIDRVPERWAAALKSDRHVITLAGQEEKMIHAHMLAFAGIQTAPKERWPINSVIYILRITVDSYFQDYPGKDDDNSEDNHGDEINRLFHRFLTTHPFGGDGTIVTNNDGSRIQMIHQVLGGSERRGISKMGDIPVRESLGEFLVELKPIQR